MAHRTGCTLQDCHSALAVVGGDSNVRYLNQRERAGAGDGRADVRPEFGVRSCEHRRGGLFLQPARGHEPGQHRAPPCLFEDRGVVGRRLDEDAVAGSNPGPNARIRPRSGEKEKSGSLAETGLCRSAGMGHGPVIAQQRHDIVTCEMGSRDDLSRTPRHACTTRRAQPFGRGRGPSTRSFDGGRHGRCMNRSCRPRA